VAIIGFCLIATAAYIVMEPILGFRPTRAKPCSSAYGYG